MMAEGTLRALSRAGGLARGEGEGRRSRAPHLQGTPPGTPLGRRAGRVH